MGADCSSSTAVKCAISTPTSSYTEIKRLIFCLLTLLYKRRRSGSLVKEITLWIRSLHSQGRTPWSLVSELWRSMHRDLQSTRDGRNTTTNNSIYLPHHSINFAEKKK